MITYNDVNEGPAMITREFLYVVSVRRAIVIGIGSVVLLLIAGQVLGEY